MIVTRRLSLAALLAAAFLFALAPAKLSPAQTASATTPARKNDIWLVDTHAIGGCDCDLGAARFYRLGEDCQWICESRESFLKTHDPARPINFFFAGYLADSNLTVEHGWRLHLGLLLQAQSHNLAYPSHRLVIWNWPSEKQRGMGFIRDARNKAYYGADHEGFLVAKLLAELPDDSKVNLVGFSFGTRIGAAAAHYLAGGPHGQCVIQPKNSPRLNGVFFASALDSDWLDHCQPYQLALGRFERLLLVNNCADRVLRFLHVINRKTRPQALGIVGLFGAEADLSKVEQFEASSIVGRRHAFFDYLDAPQIMSRVADYSFFLESKPASAAGLAKQP